MAQTNRSRGGPNVLAFGFLFVVWGITGAGASLNGPWRIVFALAALGALVLVGFLSLRHQVTLPAMKRTTPSPPRASPTRRPRVQTLARAQGLPRGRSLPRAQSLPKGRIVAPPRRA